MEDNDEERDALDNDSLRILSDFKGIIIRMKKKKIVPKNWARKHLANIESQETILKKKHSDKQSEMIHMWAIIQVDNFERALKNSKV